jgi:hypothetical protein
MKRALLLACALSMPAQIGRQTYVIEIPMYVNGKFRADYIKVYGTSTIDAIENAGLTVFDEKKWSKVCKMPRFDCSKLEVFDRRGK